MADRVGFDDGAWLNEPTNWRFEDGRLLVVTDRATDFWRETHYGFIRDTGHFFAVNTGSAFTAQLRIRANYEQLYDQAGLMVRISKEYWVKAGIELSDGLPMISSVLTLGKSDWSTASYNGDASDFWLRATISGGVLRLQVSSDGQSWPLMRLCPFPANPTYSVGPMCCTPERSGLNVAFSDFSISAPKGKDLHDLS
ncbi:DUF1349 domain-containing protein [Methylobacterium sp. PvR107]|uniref:DUF1349 domain-containing protein n=1 Tax=Methylobacterium sp. PvR107 TaxID=2806597 RepID=UPI001AE680C2|nr:DUF1349 domain-containing protein [Methylobacterium sp. PvR107]MBP1179399.1 regulation of enolase protein 1 (concanavalin A-like superfamily) [Methylobacterium sp. PvR107]